jgi:hypothetical protein
MQELCMIRFLLPHRCSDVVLQFSFCLGKMIGRLQGNVKPRRSGDITTRIFHKEVKGLTCSSASETRFAECAQFTASCLGFPNTKMSA